MAGLEGTITTPLGTVPKKTALLVGGALAGILAIAWWRAKKTASDSVAAAGSSEINPATGYPYGSAEDAAALAAQANYQFPTGGGTGGGGGGVGSNAQAYVSNAQWVQGVIEYMVAHDLVADPAQLSASLGRYITGQSVGDDVVSRSLIEQAIALQGYPPVSGPGGYPPAINTTPQNAPPQQNPPPGTQPLAVPTLTTSQRKGWIELRCNAVAGATGYRFYQEHLFKYGDVSNPAYDWWVGNSPATYRFAVAAVRNGEVGSPSPWVTVAYTAK